MLMYTYFDQTRKVLCAMQVVEDAVAGNPNVTPVFPHSSGESLRGGNAPSTASVQSYSLGDMEEPGTE